MRSRNGHDRWRTVSTGRGVRTVAAARVKMQNQGLGWRCARPGWRYFGAEATVYITLQLRWSRGAPFIQLFEGRVAAQTDGMLVSGVRTRARCVYGRLIVVSAQVLVRNDKQPEYPVYLVNILGTGSQPSRIIHT